MSDTAVALRRQDTTLPSQSEWATMLAISTELVKSGFLPNHIKSPQAAVAIILKGRELGIPPMYALSNIVVIQQRPTANSELMLSLIYRDHGDGAIRVMETTAEHCVIEYKRRSWKVAESFAFTMDDARKAGLIKPGPWQSFPAAMLRARCISAVARMAFPDSIGGLYTAEELGATVDVEDEQIVVKDITPRTEAIAAAPKAQEPHAGVMRESVEDGERRAFRLLVERQPDVAAFMAERKIDIDTVDINWIRRQAVSLNQRAMNEVIDGSASAADVPPAEPEPTQAAPAGVTALTDSMNEWLAASMAKADAWLSQVGSRDNGQPHATDLSAAKAILQEQARLLGKDAAGPMPVGAEAIVEEIARRWTALGVKLEERQRVTQAAEAEAREEIPF